MIANRGIKLSLVLVLLALSINPSLFAQQKRTSLKEIFRKGAKALEDIVDQTETEQAKHPTAKHPTDESQPATSHPGVRQFERVATADFFKADPSLKAGDVHPDAIYLDAEHHDDFYHGVTIVRKGKLTALLRADGQFIKDFHGPQLGTSYKQSGVYSIDSESGESTIYFNNKGEVIPFVTFRAHLGKPALMPAGDGYLIEFPAHNPNDPYKYLSVSRQSNIALVQQYAQQRKSPYGYRAVRDGKLAEALTGYEFAVAKNFSDGLAVVGNPDEYGRMRYFYINEQFEQAIPINFTNIPGDFHYGFAKVQTRNGEHAFIDKKGNILIEGKQVSHLFTQFHHKNYAFWFDHAVIDASGKFYTVEEYFALHGKKNVRARNSHLTMVGVSGDLLIIQDLVTIGGIEITARGFINLNTDKVTEPIFTSLELFDPVSKLAKASIELPNGNRREGYINEDGVFVIIITKEQSKW